MARAAARSAKAARQQPVRLALHAMACRFELVLAGGDAVRLRAVGEEALAEVTRCEAAWSLFRRGSILARLNERAATEPVRVDPETFELLRLCKGVHADSGGAFDPTVAAWMRARGLHEGSFVGQADPTQTGMAGVLLEPGGFVRFARPGLALDLGGVAKGMALDLAAAVLREHGVTRALFHGGTSTVIAIGAPPGRDDWHVRIAGGPTARLRDGALSVSAPHGRSVTGHDGEVTHVLDPRTGRSAAATSVTAVLAGSAALADAWSTALLVGGPALLSACPGAALCSAHFLRLAASRRICSEHFLAGGGRAPDGCDFDLPRDPASP